MRHLLVLLFIAAVPCLGDDCNSAWGYSGDKGPERWGTLNTAWKVCGTGTRQSPIDMSSYGQMNATMAPLEFVGEQSTFKVENTGHDVKVTPTKTWKLKRRNIEATLLQFHFHNPAEHKAPYVTNQAEIHFVYELPGGRYLVLVVWIRKGTTENEALKKILANKPSACGISPISTQTLSISDLLLMNTNHYATYDGSLTTPPCSENVTFIVEAEEITATEAQIAALNAVVGSGNARPSQDRADRPIAWRP